MRSLNQEILNTIRDKNIFIFGSTTQKTRAFCKFLKIKGTEDFCVPPNLSSVFKFIDNEAKKNAGYAFMLQEVIEKDILGLRCPKLAASVILDFEEYFETITKANDKFFSDRIVRSNSFDNLARFSGVRRIEDGQN